MNLHVLDTHLEAEPAGVVAREREDAAAGAEGREAVNEDELPRPRKIAATCCRSLLIVFKAIKVTHR